MLAGVIEQIRSKFEPFKESELATLARPTISVFISEIGLGENYSEESGLAEKLKNKEELEKATSEDGLKLLKGEVAALKALRREIDPVLSASEKLIEIDPVSKSKELKAKEEELEVLAKALIPSGATLEKLLALIRPANEVCNLHSPETEQCPLCKQALRDSELELFKQYSALLTRELDAAITELQNLLKTAKKSLKVISDSTPSSWAKDSVLPTERTEPVKAVGETIQERFKVGLEIDQDNIGLAASLRNLAEELSKGLRG